MSGKSYFTSNPQEIFEVLRAAKPYGKGPSWDALRLLMGGSITATPFPDSRWKKDRKLLVEFLADFTRTGDNQLQRLVAVAVDASATKIAMSQRIKVQTFALDLTLAITGKLVLGQYRIELLSEFQKCFVAFLPFLEAEFAYHGDALAERLAHRNPFALSLRKQAESIRGLALQLATESLQAPPQVGNLGFYPYLHRLSVKYGSDSERLLDELVMVLVATYESSARLLSNVLVYLGQDHALQRELRQRLSLEGAESQSVLEANPELFSLIQESLRLWPVTPQMTMDVCSASASILGETEIRTGDRVTILLDEMHRSEANWKSPLEFRLDRFSNDCTHGRATLPYAPFGAGKRLCPGRLFALHEVAYLVCELLTRYDIKSSDSGRRTGRFFAGLTDNVSMRLVQHTHFTMNSKNSPRR